MFISCFSRFSRPDKFDESAVNINMSRTTHKPGFRDIRASATVQPYRGPVHLGVRTIFLLVAIPNRAQGSHVDVDAAPTSRHYSLLLPCFPSEAAPKATKKPRLLTHPCRSRSRHTIPSRSHYHGTCNNIYSGYFLSADFRMC